MPVWLVTGGSGFLGRHLLAEVRARKPREAELCVLGRRRPTGEEDRFITADLTEPALLAEVIRAVNPSVVFHLAGRTPPGTPEEFRRANTLATVHLLDALRSLHHPVRVVLAGSAAELGPVAAEHLPVGEEYSCRPADSYGLSKTLATAAGLAARPPLEVMVARIFNPIGANLPETQAFGRFAALLAAHGPDPVTMIVGDLSPRRDFIDARDVARSLIRLAECGRAGLVYHVGTGRSFSIAEGLDHLVQLSGRRVRLQTDPRISGGVPDSRADIRRIVEHTGWRPEIPWRQSLADLWRAAAGGLQSERSH